MNPIKKLIFSLYLLLILCACSTTQPRNSVEFKPITRVSDLAGLYQNRGQTGDSCDLKPPYLSSLFFGETVSHKSILAIEIKAVSEDSIMVLGHSRNSIIKKKKYQKNDLSILNGKIRLKDNESKLIPGGSGIAGIMSEDIDLGLDIKGRLKYQKTQTGVGLAYFIVPVAGSSIDENHFDKIDIRNLKSGGGINYTPLPSQQREGFVLGELENIVLDEQGNIVRGPYFKYNVYIRTAKNDYSIESTFFAGVLVSGISRYKKKKHFNKVFAKR